VLEWRALIVDARLRHADLEDATLAVHVPPPRQQTRRRPVAAIHFRLSIRRF